MHSDNIHGPKNQVCDIISDHNFCRYRNSIQVIHFQVNDSNALPKYASIQYSETLKSDASRNSTNLR